MNKPRPIPGFPKYGATEDGGIWSYKSGEWKRLKDRADSVYGHRRVQLYVPGGKPKGSKFWVHRLVLRAFVGPPPPKAETLHLDSNPGNNNPSNLRWGSRSENALTREAKMRLADVFVWDDPVAALDEEEIPF